MRKIGRSSFITQVNALKKATSVQGKVYHNIWVDGNSVWFTRQNKSKQERIDLDELFALYQSIDYPTTKEAWSYISGRVQSPAVSIINALGKESLGTNTEKQVVPPIQSANPGIKRSKVTSRQKVKDEARFFRAFAELVGPEFLLSKSIGKSINSEDIFLSDDFRDYTFSDKVWDNFKSFLRDLNSNFNFSGKSIAHNIDGLLINHPKLGSRLIEFDEEQHFTPSLLTVMSKQTQFIELGFTGYYHETLKDIQYLNNDVLRKNRIKHRFETYPLDHNIFIDAIKNEKVSGYIKPIENGFNYIGGRLAQRAYYDSLRNAAHLSSKNQYLNPILRFPKKFFEDKTGMKFSSLSDDQIKVYIKDCMKDIYGIKI